MLATITVIEELIKTVFEEIISAAFGGIFRRARSRKARTLKFTAWVAMISSIALFVVAGTFARGNMVAVAFMCGALSTAAFFFFGTWASVINAKVEHDGG